MSTELSVTPIYRPLGAQYSWFTLGHYTANRLHYPCKSTSPPVLDTFTEWLYEKKLHVVCVYATKGHVLSTFPFYIQNIRPPFHNNRPQSIISEFIYYAPLLLRLLLDVTQENPCWIRCFLFTASSYIKNVLLKRVRFHEEQFNNVMNQNYYWFKRV